MGKEVYIGMGLDSLAAIVNTVHDVYRAADVDVSKVRITTLGPASIETVYEDEHFAMRMTMREKAGNKDIND